MAPATRGASLKRRVRSVGGTFIRRMGLLPGGVPDRNGDDARLATQRLDAEVLVFFADTEDGLYQLRQWYAPLAALDARHRIAVVTADSRTAALIRAETGFEVVTVARYATLDGLLARSDVRLVLYVNHNPENFSMLRFASVVHVSLLHGDSDKVVSVSNQAKAYDFSFVAGRAAVDRMARYLPLFDAERRCVVVGRPQLGDALALVADRAEPVPGRRRTVLYAPTWEGAQPSAAYGSVDTIGEALVAALLAEPDLRVVYRPHPLTGVRLASYGEADAAIRRRIDAARAADPGAGHTVSDSGDLMVDMVSADLLVCDVSAVAMDWLVTGRPLVVTEPASTEVVTASTPLLDATARIGTGTVGDVVAVVRSELDDDPRASRRRELAEYYLGDLRPGAATQAFLTACEEAIAAHRAASAD
ncbi:CDP-glycerol glycerophosphotransferase family protein [Luteimicrobium sp. NPDC057192]|uniref:CDP-glycerol glycerophosphotransferase family protein n=1 Tax=Luteimicrobium sp. NPDC057192 TaxID=3346042 RepID=UPI00362B8F85